MFNASTLPVLAISARKAGHPFDHATERLDVFFVPSAVGAGEYVDRKSSQGCTTSVAEFTTLVSIFVVSVLYFDHPRTAE